MTTDNKLQTPMIRGYRFNRMEVSGSLGDLGALLPLILGMIMVNGMSITGIFYSVGLFYICAGIYFGVPIPVQPMKAISAYAIATGVTASQVSSSALLVCLILFLIGITGTIDHIGRLIPKPVIRGVQLSTGMLLMTQGAKLISGQSDQQLAAGSVEPFFSVQALAGVDIGIILGTIGALLSLFLMRSKKYPAGIVLILFGILCGIVWGTYEGFAQFRPGLYFPEILPFGFPSSADLSIAFFVLVLPQIPMTIGNAIIANADLSNEYFGQESRKVTYRATTLSMAFANGLSTILGGIPLCHGAGGLAAHYKFGARTGGSNIIIGGLFLGLALLCGPHILAIIHLLPLSILGVLLIFAGSQLALTILDMFARKDMFIILLMLTITLTSNLAWGFGIGLVAAHIIKSDRVVI